MLLKLAALSTVLGLGIAVPATGVLHAKTTRDQVEQRLLRQMNSGADGRITRAVRCRAGGAAGAFACTLESTRATALHAEVVARGGGLQETWEPLRG